MEKALSKWAQREPADSDVPGIQRIYLRQNDPLELQKLVYSLDTNTPSDAKVARSRVE